MEDKVSACIILQHICTINLSLSTVTTDDTYMYFLESSWDITVGILIMIKLVNIYTHSYW